MKKIQCVANSIEKVKRVFSKKNRMPKITVVITIYNLEAYVGQCIESVLRQTFTEFEILCVNDGSTDRSEEIIKFYIKQDKRVRLITKENGGLSAARNTGIENARGEYLYFLDGDDYISENALELLYMNARVNAVDILMFNGTPVYESSELEETYATYKKYYHRKQEYPDIMSGRNMLLIMNQNGDYKVSCCLQLFRTDFLVKEGILFKEGILYEDNLFTLLAMIKAERVQYIEDVLFFRRIRNNSISTSELTSKNVISYYECMKGIADMKVDTKDDRELIKRFDSHLRMFRKRISSTFEGLNDTEKKKVIQYMIKEGVIGVSAIAATYKEEQIQNIISNYQRQTLANKELLIILNKDSIDIRKVQVMTQEDPTIHVYQVSEKATLGECLNYGVVRAKYSYVSKIDDDDYYGEAYFDEIVRTFLTVDCDIVGKSDYYTYIWEKECLCKWKNNKSNSYVRAVAGGTISCKRMVLEELPFDRLKVGTDKKFLEDANKKNYKVYSTSNSNYLYIRGIDNEKHTWKIQPSYYMENPKCKTMLDMDYEEIIRHIGDMSVYN